MLLTTSMKNKFKIDDQIKKKNSNWNFKGNVYKYFDKHIKKSVPLYFETQNLYLKLSDFFLQDNSKIIDLGCSTGRFLTNLYNRHKVNQKKIKYYGIDNTNEMIRFCKKEYNGKKDLIFKNQDIMKFDLSGSCIISSFYTIQFISPKKRQILINKIYKNLNWGGAFFFIEKVRGGDARFQDIMTQTYNEFKISQGFTSDEIIAKSRSLKGVLEPFSTTGNLDLIKRAGFKDVMTVFKYICFEGFLAIK
jgi:tRNA (cmo5U34)-methyltransferase